MTHVSRKKLDKNSEELFVDALFNVLAKADKKQVKEILSILVSSTELTMLYKRLIIILLLNQGYAIDEITNATNTTRQTVSRINLLLKVSSKEAKDTLLKRLSLWHKRNLVKDVLKSLLEIPSPTKSIRDSARRATGI